jgi:hypothetical protein
MYARDGAMRGKVKLVDAEWTRLKTRPLSAMQSRASGLISRLRSWQSARPAELARVIPWSPTHSRRPMLPPEMSAIVSVMRVSCRSGEFLAAVVRHQGSGRQTAGQLAWGPAVSHREDEPSSDGVALVDRYFKHGAGVKAPALEELREIQGGLVARSLAAAAVVPTCWFVGGTDRA